MQTNLSYYYNGLYTTFPQKVRKVVNMLTVHMPKCMPY